MAASEQERSDGGKVSGSRIVEGRQFTVINIPPESPEDVKERDNIQDRKLSERMPKNHMTEIYDGFGTAQIAPTKQPQRYRKP